MLTPLHISVSLRLFVSTINIDSLIDPGSMSEHLLAMCSRAMQKDELQDAIRRPMHSRYPLAINDPGTGKRFDPDLVNTLSKDAAHTC